MNLIIISNSNVSYIDNLLVCFFYLRSNFESVLDKSNHNPTIVYLQEYLKYHFINPLRGGKSIINNTLNNILNITYKIGWDDSQYEGPEKLYEYYSFMLKIFDIQLIKLINKNIIIDLPFIKLDAINDGTIYKLINEQLSNNLNKADNYFNNIPYIIGIKIVRNKYNKNYAIDINKRISSHVKDNKHKWDFYFAICYDKLNNMYYSILKNNKKLILYNSNLTPSFSEIAKTDVNIISKIKCESCFITYKLLY